MNTLIFALSVFFIVGQSPRNDQLDSLLENQRIRCGDNCVKLFSHIDNARRQGLTTEEVEDLRFLVAYLPLSDLAMMSVDDMYENVRLARVARNHFIWGEKISDNLYRHFVLPHRISQEPFVAGWREQFLEELMPRVEELTMTEAALEVNHWCLEQATFRQSSGRDQDPLTTIRSGFGRCEEEMILTIAAMRSIGIPARQCYTPYWAHCDNNHAWVEVWADGKWEYMGGCEPKPALSDAWFTRSAGRAMLVVSTAYGDYYGDEQVLRRYGRSTLINSTGVYGKTRNVKISVLDQNNNPLKDQRVIFSLFNYGGLMPMLAVNTGDDGACQVECGLGSWFAASGKDECSTIIFNSPQNNDVSLKQEKDFDFSQLSDIDYYPPPELPPLNAEQNAQDNDAFNLRIQRENELRAHNTWNIWAREAGIPIQADVSLKPDFQSISRLERELAQIASPDSGEVLDLMLKAAGNWGKIYHFLTNQYPVTQRPSAIQAKAMPHPDVLEKKWLLVKTLTDKDLLDFNEAILYDHFNFTTLEAPLANIRTASIHNLKDDEYDRYIESVLTPRIDWEPSTGWRQPLTEFFNAHSSLIKSKNDKSLIKWLRKNIAREEKSDRLGSSLAPDHTLVLKRGTILDINRLYIAMCRVRGIPSRINSVNGTLECWIDDQWNVVDVLLEDEKEAATHAKGNLTIIAASSLEDEAPDAFNQLPESPESWHDVANDSTLRKVLYYKDWMVQKWETDHLAPIDFGYHTPYSELEWPQELITGKYCLSTGFRREDGSVPLRLIWFEIKDGEETQANMSFRKLE